MHVGLCGYPGSGRTTLFQALAPGARAGRGVTYGNIKVPDDRVDRLARIFRPRKTTWAEITFVDVGGPPGAAGTGAFPPEVVQAMRNADVLVHVVRDFDNPLVGEPADPERDIARFNDELLLLDLGIMERRVERFRKEHRKGPEVDASARCLAWLEEGRPLRTLDLQPAEAATLTGVQLLSRRPLITLRNVAEERWEALPPRRDEAGGLEMAVCGKLEAEIAALPPEDRDEFLEAMGLEEPASHAFIRAAYDLLDLVSFLTAGEDECRAWPIRRGTTARKAAGRIHSDIERGFIRAEVYRLEDLEAHGSEAALKQAGLVRLEGKDYVVQDGDVVHFRFNV